MSSILPQVDLYREAVGGWVSTHYQENDDSCVKQLLPRAVVVARPIIEALAILYHTVAALIKTLVAVATLNQLQHCSWQWLREFSAEGAGAHFKLALEGFGHFIISFKGPFQALFSSSSDIVDEFHVQGRNRSIPDGAFPESEESASQDEASGGSVSSMSQVMLECLARQGQENDDGVTVIVDDDFGDFENESGDEACPLMDGEVVSILEAIKSSPLDAEALSTLNAQAIGKFDDTKQQLMVFAKCAELEWQKLKDYFESSGDPLDVSKLTALLNQVGDHGQLLDLVRNVQAKQIVMANASAAAEFFEKFGQAYVGLGYSQEDLLALAKSILENFCMSCDKRQQHNNAFVGDHSLIRKVFSVLEASCSTSDLDLESLILGAWLHRSYFVQTLGEQKQAFVRERLLQKMAEDFQLVVDHEHDLRNLLFDAEIRDTLAQAFYEYALVNKSNEDVLIQAGQKVGLYASPGSVLRQEMDRLMLEFVRTISEADAQVPSVKLQRSRSVTSLFKRLRESERDERKRLKDAFEDALGRIKNGIRGDELGQYSSIGGFLDLLVSLHREGAGVSGRLQSRAKDLDLQTAWIAYMLWEMADNRDQLPYSSEEICRFCNDVKDLFSLSIDWEAEPDLHDFSFENSLLIFYSKA